MFKGNNHDYIQRVSARAHGIIPSSIVDVIRTLRKYTIHTAATMVYVKYSCTRVLNITMFVFYMNPNSVRYVYGITCLHISNPFYLRAQRIKQSSFMI